MIRGLYTAVSGMISQEAIQDQVTNNIANVNTVGFKKDTIALRQFKDVLIGRVRTGIGDLSSNSYASPLGKLSLGSRIDETKTYFSQGSIDSTDKTTDFAIDGPGFFTIRKSSDNKIYYTRDGHFHVDNSGNLVTDSGDNVLDNSGNNINVGYNDIKSDELGNLTLGGNNVKFGIVDFSDYNSLKKVGDNLYEGGATKEAQGYRIKQKSLEKSNVSITDEMINMMTTMRTFETNQKIVQMLDQTLGQAVTVGSVK